MISYVYCQWSPMNTYITVQGKWQYGILPQKRQKGGGRDYNKFGPWSILKHIFNTLTIWSEFLFDGNFNSCIICKKQKKIKIFIHYLDLLFGIRFYYDHLPFISYGWISRWPPWLKAYYEWERTTIYVCDVQTSTTKTNNNYVKHILLFHGLRRPRILLLRPRIVRIKNKKNC